MLSLELIIIFSLTNISPLVVSYHWQNVDLDHIPGTPPDMAHYDHEDHLPQTHEKETESFSHDSGHIFTISDEHEPDSHQIA